MTGVERSADVRSTLEQAAMLFRYPDAAFPARLRDAAKGLPEGFFEAFVDEASRCELSEVQCIYTATFDLGPSCSPYLGIHLFGDESRDRARLMVGLRMAYRREGFDDGTELPDHIAEVLRFAARFSEDEWAELVRLVLVPALTKMDELLRRTVNPYRHLVAATLRSIESLSTHGQETSEGAEVVTSGGGL